MKNIFTDGWELRCDAQFQARNNDKIKAYICSPLRADTINDVRKNMLTAKAYMLYALEAIGIYAYAPHAYLPIILSDDDSNQRQLALQFGTCLLAQSNLLYVCGDRITEGMKSEIIYAARLNKQINTFNVSVYMQVVELLSALNANTDIVSLHLGYSPLGSARPITEYLLNPMCGSFKIKESYNGLPV